MGNDSTPCFFTVGLDNVSPDDETTVELNDFTIGDTVLDLALALHLVNSSPRVRSPVLVHLCPVDFPVGPALFQACRNLAT